MGHAHAHAQGEGEGNYFLDQLFTILSCGAVGIVAVLMYQTGMLGRILVPMFFVPVLLGGIAILVLTAIRAVAVWKLAGARAAEAKLSNSLVHEGEHSHSHSHSHGHDHAHDHEDCGHDHSHGAESGNDHAHADDHGHDHGWAPWRYMVLAIPVFLYFLDLPRAGGLSIPEQKNAGQLQHSPQRQALAVLTGGPSLTKVLRKTEPRRLTLRFTELSEAAAVPGRHDIYEGDIGVIRGQYIPMQSSDREFTLFRWKVTCCNADAVPMETRIEAPEPVQGVQREQWVQVAGLISFQKNEKGKWVAVITLKSNDDITPAEPTSDSSGF